VGIGHPLYSTFIAFIAIEKDIVPGGNVMESSGDRSVLFCTAGYEYSEKKDQ
jgi:hypothetical protein